MLSESLWSSKLPYSFSNILNIIAPPQTSICYNRPPLFPLKPPTTSFHLLHFTSPVFYLLPSLSYLSLPPLMVPFYFPGFARNSKLYSQIERSGMWICIEERTHGIWPLPFWVWVTYFSTAFSNFHPFTRRAGGFISFLYWWIAHHCVCAPHSHHPLISWWTSRLLWLR